MARHTEGDPAVSRRTVLAGLGATVGLAGATGSALGQDEGVTARAALPQTQEYQVESLPGYFIHVDPDPDPVQAPLAEECEYANWPREETMAYEVLLIDRKDDDHWSTETAMYVPDDRSVPAGGLYVINDVERCAGSYVGVEVEEMVADVSVLGEVAGNVDAGAAEDRPETTQTGGDGTGFGLLAGLSGLAGAGALARWRDRRE
ncbi:hypothetical protein [Halorientalis halophila]|uniref:hypothetical protein n=1 Tax=Halorientalis halophila TaxID=3108499 RepID=UPI003008F30A